MQNNDSQKFVINGGTPLRGTIISSGAKNSAIKMVAASVLTQETVTLENVPHIQDVQAMLELVSSMGGQVEWLSQTKVSINCKDVDPAKLDQTKVGHLRGSIVLIGPLLARFGKLRIHEPGGCLIGARPITSHLNALKSLGAVISKQGKFYTFEAKKMGGAIVLLDELSVTTTENILMAATLADGETQIHLAVTEPEIANLIDLLLSMGAKIQGKGTNKLVISGQPKLHGGSAEIIPDRIEIGSYACAIAATGGSGTIQRVIPEHLFNLLNKFDRIGIPYKFKDPITDPLKINDLIIEKSQQMKAVDFDTRPYPGFSTDLQAPMVVLLTQTHGKSKIFETLFEGRLQYINTLKEMGADIEIIDRRNIVINGPSKLSAKQISSPDLRAGATYIIAGLVAEGQTTVLNAKIIDRGYERIEEKLVSLGANIVRR